jgi:hypothetical protein
MVQPHWARLGGALNLQKNKKNKHPTTSNKKTCTLQQATKKRVRYNEQQKTNTLQQATKKRVRYNEQQKTNTLQRAKPIQPIQPFKTLPTNSKGRVRD